MAVYLSAGVLRGHPQVIPGSYVVDYEPEQSYRCSKHVLP